MYAMGKKTFLFTTHFLLLLLLLGAGQAEGFSIAKADDTVSIRVKEEIKVRDGTEEKGEARIKISDTDIEDEDKKEEKEEKQRDEEKESEFRIDGVVTALNVSENSFVIGGKTIFINTTKVPKFHQLGILSVGARVKVRGIIIDNTLYAEDINVVGTGQGRFQIKEENSLMVEIKALLQQITSILKQRLNILSEVKI